MVALEAHLTNEIESRDPSRHGSRQNCLVIQSSDSNDR